jgi:hypothetical protein
LLLVVVVKEVRYFLHKASLNFEMAGKGAKTENRTENVSVDVVEDDEDRRVYTEVTNRLRSKCIVDAKSISCVGSRKQSAYGTRQISEHATRQCH